jgi:hypothetical protein
MPTATVSEFGLDQFVGEMVMVVGGETITVRDLIDFTANADGAVHFGDITKDKRAILAAIDKRFTLQGVQASLQSLLAVGLIVVDALDPLVKQIEAEAGAAD